MGITNRSKDGSEQIDVFTARVGGVVTGASYGLFPVPYPCQLQAADFAAFGLSGSPQVKLQNFRWTADGSTVIELGVSNLIFAVATGTSGAASGWSGIASLGSTLLNLQRGDILQIETAGNNAAALEVTVSLALKKVQDIVSHLGLST